MSKTAKLLITILTITMLTSMLSGCNTAKKPETAKVTTTKKKPVTLTWFGSQSSKPLTDPIQKDDVMTELTKKTGVTLDFSPEIGGDSNKLSILIAGGDLPDVIVAGQADFRTKLLNAKAVIPLDALIKTNGKDIEKNCDFALKMSKLLRSGSEDKLYFIPGGANGSDLTPQIVNNTWNIRWDLYNKIGKPKLDTLDELLNALKKMQELEPTTASGKKTYGLGSFLGEDWGWMMVDKAIANNAGLVNASVIRDAEKDQIITYYSDPNSIWWKSMQFYNKAYQMGVLDPESATMKYTNAMDKGKEGRYFAAPTNWSLGGADQEFITKGTPDKGYVPFIIQGKKDYMHLEEIGDGGTQFDFSITTACKNPDRAMDVFNFLASYEGAEIFKNGVEGKNWNMQNGKPIFTDETFKNINDDTFLAKTGIGKYNNVLINNASKDPKGFPTNFKEVPETLLKALTPVQKDFSKANSLQYPTEFITKIPHHGNSTSIMKSIQPDSKSDIAQINVKLNAYLAANTAKPIYAKNDADFSKAKDQYISDIKAIGEDKLVKWFSDKYIEMKDKVKNMK